MTMVGVQLYEPVPNTHERCYRSDINIEHWTLILLHSCLKAPFFILSEDFHHKIKNRQKSAIIIFFTYKYISREGTDGAEIDMNSSPAVILCRLSTNYLLEIRS